VASRRHAKVWIDTELADTAISVRLPHLGPERANVPERRSSAEEERGISTAQPDSPSRPYGEEEDVPDPHKELIPSANLLKFDPRVRIVLIRIVHLDVGDPDMVVNLEAYTGSWLLGSDEKRLETESVTCQGQEEKWGEKR
jgi:hypothetical protein